MTIARKAYGAYGERVGWKNYLGKPMPKFDDLPANIQAGWMAAVQTGYVEVNKAIGGETEVEVDTL
jgi:hypothetical protein